MTTDPRKAAIIGCGAVGASIAFRFLQQGLFSKLVLVDVNRAKAEGRRVIAVGTTSLRTLEAVGQNGQMREGSGWTDIFIYPGYTFQIIDGLLTNFHLPKSTLLMLVSALAGRERVLKAYEEAVRERYRFFSFGDCMLIL